MTVQSGSSTNSSPFNYRDASHPHRTPSKPTLSVILVAERPTKGIHHIPKPNIIRHEPERQHIIQRHLRAGWRVPESRSPGDDVLPAVDIKILPDCLGPVDHAVVKEEAAMKGQSSVSDVGQSKAGNYDLQRIARTAVEIAH